MKLKFKCGHCGKDISWIMSWRQRLKELFQNKKPLKVCGDCYEKFKLGK